MARRVELFNITDFTGGLDLRGDAFTVPDNAVTDCLNVRLLPQGGWERRPTMRSVGMVQDARNLWTFYGNGVQQIIAQDGNDARYSTGGSFTLINPDALATTGRMRAATMARVGTASSERCYVQRNAEQVPWKWSGSAATVLAAAEGSFNENLASPAGGRMPVAKYITTHAGYMWHANTVESGTTYQTRVRWSHPGEPEDYRANDFVYIGGEDGDDITGIASFQEKLYVFKQRSVWVIAGYAPENFQVIKVYDGAGAVEQEAIAVAPDRLYFYDEQRGVFAINDKGQVDWLFENLVTLHEDNTIPIVYRTGICMAWLDKRLFVSVPWDSETTNQRVFVYDPLLGRGGGWYQYHYAEIEDLVERVVSLGPMAEFRPVGGSPLLVACNTAATGSVVEIDYDAEGTTDVWDSTTELATDSFDRANNAAALGSIESGYFAGVAWTQNAGTWGINTNKAYTSASTAHSIATVDLGTTRVYLQCTVEQSGTGSGAGLVFFYVDANNHWRLRLDGTDAIFERVASGVVTQVGVTYNNVLGSPTVVEFDSTNGEDVVILLHGASTSLGLFALFSGYTITGTKFGLYSDSNTDARFNDFSADFLASGTSEFTSHVTTSWFDVGLPGVKKRWRRPTFVVDADSSAIIGVNVYHDYTSLSAARTSSFTVTPESTGGGVWNPALPWGVGTWGSAPDGEQAIIRGSTLGSAYAVQLRVEGPQDTPWGLNAIDMRYIPRRIR